LLILDDAGLHRAKQTTRRKQDVREHGGICAAAHQKFEHTLIVISIEVVYHQVQLGCPDRRYPCESMLAEGNEVLLPSADRRFLNDLPAEMVAQSWGPASREIHW